MIQDFNLIYKLQSTQASYTMTDSDCCHQPFQFPLHSQALQVNASDLIL
jgi:hypothetical protein